MSFGFAHSRPAGIWLLAVASLAACGGDGGGAGSDPPSDAFNFPVGLAVSAGGSALYVANADFDLQYNAGTILSLDLKAIRAAAAESAAKPCSRTDVPQGSTLGQICAPPVGLKGFLRSTVQIGAFASDLQISTVGFRKDGADYRRLYTPVRGTASVVWVDVPDDQKGGDPHRLDCGGGKRCDVAHNAGNRASEPGNTRGITMPGEPTVMAQSSDGAALVIGHVGTDQLSLLSTGLPAGAAPSLQFVLTNLKNSAGGLVTLPAAVATPGQDLLVSSRNGGIVNKVRYVPDDSSAIPRPYLAFARNYQVAGNGSGYDSRGMVVDSSAREACVRSGGGEACAAVAMPVFIANRSPASVLYGQLAPVRGGAGDELTLTGSLPLPLGPSRLYLSPIIDEQGLLRRRLFAVSFDASSVVAVDTETLRVEGTVRTGPGPYALAFDVEGPTLTAGATAPSDYRFMYVGSFTQSFVQVIDLDRRSPTYLRVVYTLGVPRSPKGS